MMCTSGNASRANCLLAMINDSVPPHAIQSFKYVDDLTFVETRSAENASNMQTAANSLSEWSTKNNMRLNPTKCQQMEISFMRNPPVPPVIRISDHTSEVVDALKLLGIHIQSDLKWETHIL